MNKDLIQYKTKTASEKDIQIHLTKCDKNFLPTLSTRVNIETYTKKINDKAITFEAWKETELIGLIAIYFNEVSKIGFITNVSVCKEFNRKGIASKLMKMCFDYGTNHQCKTVQLEVNNQDMNAISFYEKNKFVKIASAKDNVVTMGRVINNITK